MVHVLAKVSPTDWRKVSDLPLLDGDLGLRLALPKMTYCKAQPDIYIRRTGYRFSAATTAKFSETRVADIILKLITSDFENGRVRSTKSIEDEDLGQITRAQHRLALEILESQGLIERRKKSGAGNSTFWHAIRTETVAAAIAQLTESSGEIKGEAASLPSEKDASPNPNVNSPPYRTGSGGEFADATTPPQLLNLAASLGEIRRVGDMDNQNSHFRQGAYESEKYRTGDAHHWWKEVHDPRALAPQNEYRFWGRWSVKAFLFFPSGR